MILPNINITSLGEFKYCSSINEVEFPKVLNDDMFCLISDDEGEDMLLNEEKYCMLRKSYNNISNELEKLKAENKRLIAQLKELREKLKIYEEREKAHEKALENALEVTSNIVDNIEEKISEVCSRTLCSQREALDILSQNDYNVDKAITIINWSKLNVPSVIL